MNLQLMLDDPSGEGQQWQPLVNRTGDHEAFAKRCPTPGQAKLAGSDASRVWVSFFCPGIGWIDVDPTNNLVCSMQHITLGLGRDYSDVSPARGVILGGGSHTLEIAVDVVPLENGAGPHPAEETMNNFLFCARRHGAGPPG